MTRLLPVSAVAATLLAAGCAAVEPNGAGGLAEVSGGTVNSYTAAQEDAARRAAAQQGFTPGRVLWAQADHLFLTATKDGREHQLTVTPQGQVHASRPG